MFSDKLFILHKEGIIGRITNIFSLRLFWGVFLSERRIAVNRYAQHCLADLSGGSQVSGST